MSFFFFFFFFLQKSMILTLSIQSNTRTQFSSQVRTHTRAYLQGERVTHTKHTPTSFPHKCAHTRAYSQRERVTHTKHTSTSFPHKCTHTRAERESYTYKTHNPQVFLACAHTCIFTESVTHAKHIHPHTPPE